MLKLGNQIKKIKKIYPDNYSIDLLFLNGNSGSVSLKSIFENPRGLAAEIVKGQMFNRCFIESGALAWPNGFELCPDFLFQLLNKSKNSKKAA
jgi:hypothetical protein